MRDYDDPVYKKFRIDYLSEISLSARCLTVKVRKI